MLTLVEGPDGAGKTTLVNQLTAQWTQHHGPLKDPFKVYLHDYVLAPHGTVLDRSYPSEHVYGPVLRGKNLVTPALTRMLNRVMLGRQGVLVKCLPSHETCKAAWSSRLTEEYVQAATTYDQLYEGYARFQTDLPTLTYDWEAEDLTSLRSRLAAARPPVNQGPGTGCFRPGNILLVGEQVTVEAPYDLPFVRDKGCAVWLADQLNQVGISEQGLYWVNAMDRLGRETAADFLTALQPSTVIALGKTAAHWCARHLSRWREVPHPQYWKRFKAREPYPLLTLLKELETHAQL